MLKKAGQLAALIGTRFLPEAPSKASPLGPRELWHIDTTYLKAGGLLWCSRGHFRIEKLTPEGVVVRPHPD